MMFPETQYEEQEERRTKALEAMADAMVMMANCQFDMQQRAEELLDKLQPFIDEVLERAAEELKK